MGKFQVRVHQIRDISIKFPPLVPNDVLLRAAHKAQHQALSGTEHLTPSVSRVNLFWTQYNFEFRQIIERWIDENAYI